MENISGYYLMPHPPIIIPDIGKGEEKKIENTSSACNEIGKEIAELKPETIIVITPHAAMFADAIAISDEDTINGDLRMFRCPEVKMNISIDREFNSRLNNKCRSEGISTALVNSRTLRSYNHNFELDHGTMVPLYFVNKYYTDYKLVHITYSMIGDINLYRFGVMIKETSNELNRKCVVIASGDLSHKLKEEGPYSYSPYGPKFDTEFTENLKDGNVRSIFNMDKKTIEGAGQCGLNSAYILLGSMEGRKFKGQLLSYEGPFGVGYGVMKFIRSNEDNHILDEIIKEKDEKFKFKVSHSNIYTKLARENLNHYYSYGTAINDISNLSPELLNNKHGVFVSLKKFGALRGCIGTFLPTTDCVAQEIIRNSLQAALHDPRFPKVTEDELKDIDISVDILTEPVKAAKDELDPKKYGVIVTKGYNRGLLLPDLDGVDTVEKQLEIACSKGNIDIYDDYEIEKFEVIRYKED